MLMTLTVTKAMTIRQTRALWLITAGAKIIAAAATTAD